MERKPALFTALIAVMGITLVFTGCKDDETPTDPNGGGGGISSAGFPNNTADLTVGGPPASGVLTGGVAPYSIAAAPSGLIALAALSGTNMDTLTITPFGPGTTSVVIEDASTLMADGLTGQTVTIDIIVSTGGGGGGGFGGSGSFTALTSAGNIIAEGMFDSTLSNLQGVGGVVSTTGNGQTLTVVAYNARAVDDADIAVLILTYEEGDLMIGTYPFFGSAGSSAILAVGFGLDGLNIDPDDPPPSAYIAFDGDGANLTLIAAGQYGGDFSGSGFNSLLQPITFEVGEFNVSGVPSGDPPGKSILTLAEKMVGASRANQVNR